MHTALHIQPKPPIPRRNQQFAIVVLGDLEEKLKNARHEISTARSNQGGNRRFRHVSRARQRPTAKLIPVIRNPPMLPTEARAKYSTLLNACEMTEILEYGRVSSLGHLS
jgi:hypothetical protein